MTQGREEEVSAAGRQNGASHTWGRGGLQAVVNIGRVRRKPARRQRFSNCCGEPTASLQEWNLWQPAGWV